MTQRSSAAVGLRPLAVLVGLTLLGASRLAAQAANPEDEVRRRIEEAQKKIREDAERLRLQGRALSGKPEHVQEERFGAVLEAPGATLREQFDLPRGQGLVLRDVPTGSAASKAGLKANDVLLELNGKPASSEAAEFARQLADIKADTPVDVVVLRKGKKETIKGLTLPEARAIPAPPVHSTTTLSRNGDQFNVRHNEGPLSITISGKVDDGKAVPAEIVVQDGFDRNRYPSIDKVPEKYRDQAQRLIDFSGPLKPRAEAKKP
jgi:hypothetical protein